MSKNPVIIATGPHYKESDQALEVLGLPDAKLMYASGDVVNGDEYLFYGQCKYNSKVFIDRCDVIDKNSFDCYFVLFVDENIMVTIKSSEKFQQWVDELNLSEKIKIVSTHIL